MLTAMHENAVRASSPALKAAAGTPPRVLISGAGIAGPALAFWLQRAGFQTTVVERSPRPRPGGQAVDIRGAARTVVARMGLLDQIRQASLQEHGFAYVDDGGRHQARMPATLFGGEGIVADLEILRGDLSEILLHATRAETTYRFDDAIASLDQTPDGVHVTFASGACDTFALVVGADGVHSRVRALAFGADDAAAIAPLGASMAYFSAPFHIDTNGWFLMYNAPGGRLAAVRPAGDGRTQALLSYAARPDAAEQPDAEQVKRRIAERFGDLGWEVPRILRAMWDAPDFYCDHLAQVHLPRWSVGRVVLLGDAGYSPSPLTGLGTSLALVGAYVLAGELARADGDYARAFGAYEGRLRGYVERAQQLPPGGVGGFLPRSRAALWLRTQSMRLMTAWPGRALLARTFEAAGSIELPDEPRLAAAAAPELALQRRSG
jgi:2-polyprenyl-6-methoxyphenol hydroxylase-like FAD-dependent oxidoreductase